jgi:hypothetical protein
MGSRAGVDVQRKLKGLIGCVLGGILETAGGFSLTLSFKVGDEFNIRFWHDAWCGEVALKYSFPKLLSIARNKEALVPDYLDSSDSSIHWNSSFIGAILDWELES